MKIIKAIALTAISCSLSQAWATTLTPSEIFEKWVKIQHSVKDRDLTELWPSLNESYLQRFKKNYEESIHLLRTLQPLLTEITAGSINEHGYLFKPPMSSAMQNNITHILGMLEDNPALFIEFLKKINFSDASEVIDKSGDFNFTVEKYKALTKLLISTKTTQQEEEFSIAIANRLVEFCYEKETFPLYQALLQRSEHHSIGRMLHTIIWYNLIGNGWKLWHDDCLMNLKKAAALGKRIKYIAGGNDVYTLLAQGIYNITIIDPFLPSQARYYANGWEWFLSGNINDEVVGLFGTRDLKLVRTKQNEGESFLAKAANQLTSLKKFATTWTVYDNETDEQLGTIEIERRFVQQSDLAVTLADVFLMSYDEFIYLGLPSLLDGWGITTNAIDPNFTCYIKQMRKPVNRDFLNNLRIASITNYADLKFINLASDPN